MDFPREQLLRAETTNVGRKGAAGAGYTLRARMGETTKPGSVPFVPALAC